MLTRNMLMEYRETTGFNLGQIEKDYIQHIFLINLYRRISDELIFKGGTALQKCYGLDRFSEDLDFTLFKNISLDDTIDRVTRGMNLFGCDAESKKLREEDRSIIFQIKAKGPLFDGREKSITYLQIEISRREDIYLPTLQTNVTPLYRDLPPYMVNLMNPSEIMAEKIRAILSRERARDLYDLYFLIKKRVETKIDIIRKKLSYYDIEFDRETILNSLKRKEKLWYNELNQLVPTVPEFSLVEEEIKKWITNL